MASGWMTVKQRAKQQGIELPLVISDHSDWNELLDTIKKSKAKNILITHGQEDALVYYCKKQNLVSKPLSIQGRSDEEIEIALDFLSSLQLLIISKVITFLSFEIFSFFVINFLGTGITLIPFAIFFHL